ncbi:hypothetical protein GOP47_0010166 [Adiantum capillus-veneris]|uniref:Uncharacterized protein n=1 Tax=Adiantum capillus-veneris TaxID=13818 RepID=A0A9D4UU83_ADICA|nr:hypothetical protein GOP47_0010166 [Adiantum capillus-veneris]
MGLERAKDPSAFRHLFHPCSVLFLSSERTLTCALWEQSQIESSPKIRRSQFAAVLGSCSPSVVLDSAVRGSCSPSAVLGNSRQRSGEQDSSKACSPNSVIVSNR